MKFKYFKSLEKLTVIVFPEGTNAEAKAFRMNGRKVLIYLLLYSLFIGLAGFYFIYLTPLERIVLPSGLKKNTIEERQFEELGTKLNLLLNEVEKLKSTNSRLRNAIQLGDSSLIKEKTRNAEPKPSPGSGGDILAIFNQLIHYLFPHSQSDELYFIQPVLGFVSREFKPESSHNGLDFVVKENSPVVATASGYVVFSNYTPQYGYVIILNHSQGYLSKYKHCNLLLKKEGDYVQQGELIALSGNSGTDTSGPHLHFEIWKDGKPVNPKKLFVNY